MSSSFQNKFPRAWLLFQMTIGATFDKRKLVTRNYQGERKILEVGCSVGNLTPAFLSFKNISYLGIDIDGQAIGFASKRFASHPNHNFRHVSLEGLASEGNKFDYILFAGILHHVDDATAAILLNDALKLLSNDGKLIISEPEASRKTDNLLFKAYALLEQGEHLRSKEQMLALLKTLPVRIISSEDPLLALNAIPFPKVIRFNLIVAKHG